MENATQNQVYKEELIRYEGEIPPFPTDPIEEEITYNNIEKNPLMDSIERIELRVNIATKLLFDRLRSIAQVAHEGDIESVRKEYEAVSHHVESISNTLTFGLEKYGTELNEYIASK